MKILVALSIIMVVTTICYGQSESTKIMHNNGNFDYRVITQFQKPEWNPDDTWDVQYTVQLSDGHDSTKQLSRQWTNIIYTYLVLNESQDEDFPNIEIIKIKVYSIDLNTEWVLIFDKTNRCLLKTEEILDPNNKIKYFNPFEKKSWLPTLYKYPFIIIHDFPVFYDYPGPVEIKSKEDGIPLFIQKTLVSFHPTMLIKTYMERDYSSVSINQKTTIVWESGKIWWSSANIEVNDELMISGTLIDFKK